MDRLAWLVGQIGSIAAVLARHTYGGNDIGGGTLRRGACDPNQAAWCVGSDRPDADLGPGTYDIRIDHEAICQNARSGQEGFIRAWGH